MRQRLLDAKLPVMPSESHIVPVLIPVISGSERLGPSEICGATFWLAFESISGYAAITGEIHRQRALRVPGAQAVEPAPVLGDIGPENARIFGGAAIRGATRPGCAMMRACNSRPPDANLGATERSTVVGGGPAAAKAGGAGCGIGVGPDAPVAGAMTRGGAAVEATGPRPARNRAREARSPSRGPGHRRPRSCAQVSVAIPGPW